MRQIFSLIGIFISICGFAQTGTVSGIITSNGNPVEFASVGLEGTAFGSSTSTTGDYTIKSIPYGTYYIKVSVVGFEEERKQITLSATSPTATINFELKEKATEVTEVVISGTMKEVSKLNSPVPVEVYSKKFFQANPAPSIFESLQNVNGVRPQLNCNVCNTGDIHINGLEGPYTMVLIDGMPIVSGLSTVYGLTGIPQSLIERVEIVKGPASTLYGSEAVGGLVNIITKKPVSAPLVSVDAFGTTWAELNTDIGIKFKPSQKTQSLLGVNYFNYKNPIDNNRDGFTDVTLQDRFSVFNKLDFERKKDRKFSVAARYVYEDRWGGQMDWNPEFRGGDSIYGESIYTSRWETFGIYQLPTRELINLQFSANGHRQNSVYGNTVYIAEQYIGFGQLTWIKEIGNRHSILAGAAYRYTYYDDNTPATAEFDTLSPPANKASIIHLPGLFVQDEIKLTHNKTVLLGLRYDYNSVHGSIASPRINYKWTSTNQKNVLRISAGNGYRVANVFTEDHAALTGARSVVFEGELKPETSWNTNINFVKRLDLKKAFITLDATAFYTYFTNRIFPDYETDPNKIIYGNLDGSAISQGISLNADILFNNGLKAILGATVMDVSITENGETFRQLLTEQVTGIWSIGYTFKKAAITIDYTGNLYGPMRLPLLGELDNRPEFSPWYSIQNIQVTKVFAKGWELYGGVKNLLNFTPPANSIARSFDPFDRNVQFDANGQVIPTSNNPNALTFDPTYVFAPNQGIRGFLGFRYTIL